MKFLLLLLLSAIGVCYGQTTQRLYFDQAGKVTTAASASYYCLISQNGKDSTSYLIQTYYATGSLKASGSYQVVTYPAQWDKLFSPNFRGARKQGTHQEYYASGQLQFRGDFKEGQGEGLHVRWYESGQLLSESTLMNGQDHGPSTSYFESSTPKLQLFYSNGSLDGDVIEYDQNGKKKAKTSYKAGQRVGKTIHYDTLGQALPESK